MENNKRLPSHKKIQDVENILSFLSNAVGSVEPSDEEFKFSKYKNCYIVGCARSGTTFLHQFLIKNLHVIYPSNFISRFYYAPYIGSLYQKLFYDLDVKGELLTKCSGFEYESNLGKTQGPLAPNEFWYFWRNHFQINKRGYISEPNNNQIQSFLSGLNKIKEVFQKPLILKGMIANNSIAKITNEDPGSLIIFIKRNVEDNAKSLLNARVDFFGNKDSWYSFRTDNYEDLMRLKPEEQVIHQVVGTNNMIHDQLKNCSNSIIINYDDFIVDPNSYLSKISEVLY